MISQPVQTDRPALPAEPTWAAPSIDHSLDVTVEVPGSKSLTNRLLILAALADGPGVLRGALRSRDADLMIAALRSLGVRILEGDEPSTLHVQPGVLHGDVSIDCGLAGTVMRFIPPLAALADGAVHLDGDEGARVRPMSPVLDALRALEVGIDDNGRGLLPLTVAGTGHVLGGSVDVDASGSSQFVSGLLLAGARFDDGLTVRHIGATLPSRPHIDMTVETLRAAGVEVEVGEDEWRISPGPIAARDVRVEPDLSNAAPFMAAALVSGGTVRVPGWPTASTQPGIHLPEILARLGATTSLDDGVLSVTGTGVIHGIDADLHAVGELAPNIAALAALADSPSRLHGIAHLRGHETDRLAALEAEINGLGGRCTQTEDGLLIEPAPLHGGTFRTYHDHRMATSAAILGLRVEGIKVENIATTAKTLPDFPQMWTGMLGRI